MNKYIKSSKNEVTPCGGLSCRNNRLKPPTKEVKFMPFSHI